MVIKRAIYSAIKKHLSAPEMSIITGPRQVGKTFLMNMLEDELKKKGEKTLYLNLDLDEHFPLFESQRKLIDYIKLQVGERKAYIFIDEIQKKENAEIFLKGIYDMRLPYKFILSGSGSLELKSKISESMVGRKRFFTADPLSFEEFVNVKTDYRYEKKLQDFFVLLEKQTQSLFEEYLMYGGYPRVVLAETAEEKRLIMEDIYKSYIERDIKSFLTVDKPGAFTDLVKILSSQIGSLVNTVELSSTIGIAGKTVQRYLWYLEKTFIIKKLTPFYRNVRSEIVKSPMYYFVDIGLRNYLLRLVGLPSIPDSFTGHLFENVIFNMLRERIRHLPGEIHFWRTKDQAEVDFVVQIGLEIIPIEVKYSHLKTPQTSRSFKSFIAKYQPKKAFIVHLGEQLSPIDFKGTKIYFIPYYNCSVITKDL
ncbi:MAG: ATP-binding protein [Candidatus Levybacteria bacterium]|nr:ATP-binding protein [Candidatus Levybacteria bacterium]